MKIGVFSNAWSAHQGGGVAYVAALAQTLQEYGHVDLHFHEPISREDIEDLYPVDLEGITIVIQARPRWINSKSNLPFATLRNRLSTLVNAVADRQYGLIVRQTQYAPPPTLCRRAILLAGFASGNQLSRHHRLYLNRYARVIAYSDFAAHWIMRRWHKTSKVIYPPIWPIPRLQKKPIIIAIGRFSASERSKHQLEMVEAFKQLVGDGVAGWELHLCGTAEDPDYLTRLRDRAQGLPISIHTDPSRAELEQIVGSASIFWHATGVDYSEEERPDLMEHFGMSTAEAMSAGCVPVVIGKGGQREVVGPELQEWTWQTWPECIDKTKYLIERPEVCSRLVEIARQQATAFTFDKFRANVRDLVTPLL